LQRIDCKNNDMATSRKTPSKAKSTPAKPARKRATRKTEDIDVLTQLKQVASHVQLAPMGLYPLEGSPDGEPFEDFDTELDEDEQEGREPEPTAEELQAREALKAVLLPLLKDSLRIEVDNGHFTSPNERTVRVFFDKVCLTEASFDVSSRPEYEG
jgi:hypothetical protein